MPYPLDGNFALLLVILVLTSPAWIPFTGLILSVFFEIQTKKKDAEKLMKEINDDPINRN